MSTTDDWAVVLGPTSGSGLAIASALASDPGLHLFGVHRGRHPDGAIALGADIEGAGRRLRLRQADAGTAAGATEGADELLEIAGPGQVRVFVHAIANASVGLLVRGEAPLEPWQYEKTFASMAHSFAWWARALLDRGLLAPRARLIGLTNPLGDALIRNCGLISAAKAALQIYVRHLALELGPLGHRVNLVNYGAVPSRALEAVMPGEQQDRLTRVQSRIVPAGRACTAGEVGRLVSFLAGDDAVWFNGATIDFTGGETQSLYDAVLYPDRGELE